MIVFLDTGILGFVTNPVPKSTLTYAIKRWCIALETFGHQIVVPEICDYELRRELLRLGKRDAVEALNQFNFCVPNRFLPIEQSAMQIAAQEWARLRMIGKPTASAASLNGDVILAGQVLDQQLSLRDYVVATTNVQHLDQLINAKVWTDVENVL